MAVFGRQLGLQPEPTGIVRAGRLQDALGGGSPDDTLVPPPPADVRPRGEINLNNILLLVPAEVVSIYMTGKGLTPPDGVLPFLQANWQLICFLTCAAACFLFRLQASKPVGAPWFKGFNWGLAFWTTVAFVLWGHAVSASSPLIPGLQGSFAAFFAGLFALFAPKLVRTG